MGLIDTRSNIVVQLLKELEEVGGSALLAWRRSVEGGSSSPMNFRRSSTVEKPDRQ